MKNTIIPRQLASWAQDKQIGTLMISDGTRAFVIIAEPVLSKLIGRSISDQDVLLPSSTQPLALLNSSISRIESIVIENDVAKEVKTVIRNATLKAFGSMNDIITIEIIPAKESRVMINAAPSQPSDDETNEVALSDASEAEMILPLDLVQATQGKIAGTSQAKQSKDKNPSTTKSNAGTTLAAASLLGFAILSVNRERSGPDESDRIDLSNEKPRTSPGLDANQQAQSRGSFDMIRSLNVLAGL